MGDVREIISKQLSGKFISNVLVARNLSFQVFSLVFVCCLAGIRTGENSK